MVRKYRYQWSVRSRRAWDRQMVSGRIKINGFRVGLRQNSSISTRPLKVDRPTDVNEREAFCACKVTPQRALLFDYLFPSRWARDYLRDHLSEKSDELVRITFYSAYSTYIEQYILIEKKKGMFAALFSPKRNCNFTASAPQRTASDIADIRFPQWLRWDLSTRLDSSAWRNWNERENTGSRY